MSFLLNPFVYGGGGAGGGLPPSDFAGLTFWYDGDGSPHYDNAAVPPGALVSTDGAAVERADSAGGIPVIFYRNGMVTRKAPAAASSNGIRLQASRMEVYDKPAPGAVPTSRPPLGSIFSAPAKTLVCAVRVDNAPPDAGFAYGNMPIFGQPGGYFGLYCYRAGSSVTFQAYNWDGGADVVSASEALGSWAVIALKHESGQLRIRKNAGAWAAVASGDTSNVNGWLEAGSTSAAVDAQLVQVAAFNTALDDSDLLEVERFFGAKLGLSF